MICVLGLITHLSLITIKYFDYETTTAVYLQFRDSVESPALSVCFRYIELLDHDWAISRFGRKLLDGSTSHTEAIARNITLAEIFDHTPSVDDILIEGRTRDETTYRVEQLKSPASVQRKFQVWRFFSQDWLCYRVQTRHNGIYSYGQVATSVNPGMLFQFGFDGLLFNRTIYLAPILHRINELPCKSIYFAPIINHISDYQLNFYRVINEKVENHFLERPYASDWVDHHGMRRTSIGKCVTQLTIDRFRMVPYAEVQLESKIYFNTATNILHPHTIADNQTLRSEFEKIRDHCHQLYRNIDCHTTTYLSHVVSREERKSPKSISFRVYQSKTPTYLTIHQPMEDFFSFGLMALSCFGVWLGLSLADFNPIHLMNLFNDGRQRLVPGQMATMTTLSMNPKPMDMNIQFTLRRHQAAIERLNKSLLRAQYY